MERNYKNMVDKAYDNIAKINTEHKVKELGITDESKISSILSEEQKIMKKMANDKLGNLANPEYNKIIEQEF